MKPLPKWNIWKHVPILNATEAVSLTLNIEPHSIYEWSKGKWVYNIGKKSGMCTSIEGFADRLFLFKKCFGVNGKISLIQLANWSQSVGWNIPIELAAVAPGEPKEMLETIPAETIHKALGGIVAENVNIDELQDELIKLDVKFIVCNDLETVQIPDGTVNGERVPISNLYSVVSELCNEPRGGKLATLVRGSGASGGGATGSISQSESLISDYNSRDTAPQTNEITNNKPISQPEIPAGKQPRIAVGKLAVKAAWEIECSTKKRATAKEVLSMLQNWADKGFYPDILLKSNKYCKAVTWLTVKSKQKDYTLEACEKALEVWHKSRA